MVIIAAIDRSDRADIVVQEAEKLANAFDDEVHVVHVMTTSEFVDLGSKKAKEGDPVDMDSVRKAAADIAENTAGSLDVEFEAIGLVGEPAKEIVDYATQQETRYIVVGGRKRSPAGKALFGSTTQQVLMNAKTPVVTTIKK